MLTQSPENQSILKCDELWIPVIWDNSSQKSTNNTVSPDHHSFIISRKGEGEEEEKEDEEIDAWYS